jgi:hypothetical protein
VTRELGMKKQKTEENNEKKRNEKRNTIKLVTEKKMMNSTIDSIWHGFMKTS